MINLLPRHDFYRAIHKGLRRALSLMLVDLGSADWSDDQASQRLRFALARQLVLSAQHLHHEDQFIRPLIAAYAGEQATRIDADHDHHRAAFVELSRLLDALGEARAADRPALGHQLYLTFARFVGEDIEHMDMEERIVLPWLHAHYSDGELIAVEQAIIGSIAPDDMLDAMAMMIPAMDPAERAGLLSAMRHDAPPPVFEMVLATIRPLLEAPAYARLQADLALYAEAA